MKKGRRAELSGRGLSLSPDMLLMRHTLSEPTSQALLERGKKVLNVGLRDGMKGKQPTQCLFLITNSGDCSVLVQCREIAIPVLPLHTFWVSYSSIFVSEHQHLPLPGKYCTHLSSMSSTVLV